MKDPGMARYKLMEVSGPHVGGLKYAVIDLVDGREIARFYDDLDARIYKRWLEER